MTGFMLRLLLFLVSLFVISSPFSAQPSHQTIGIKSDGRMFYLESGEEVTGFGVNYTVPFAHAYRSAKKLGVDPKEAIDQDIYHFSRLGFDLFRVHVWDTEISDSLGHLIDNEHLNTFDYLLYRLSQNHIRFVLTPIAFWGNGWPEPDQKTPGFSHRYGKDGCLSHPDAITAQERYLVAFMEHVNPFTGLAYKDHPGLLAVEVSNEPHHRGDADLVREYINRMVTAIKSTGFSNPVFYNVSHAIQFADTYFSAGAEGGTFQWYPTGLGFQKELPGNFLPNVDRYIIPFDTVMKAHGAGRLVYEFDGADVNKSYIYPAMARSFRQAGIQLATHFSYDPLFLAPFNTEYNTHYMNLAYAPHKALALMISAKIFRELPICQELGSYPENTRFGPFSIDAQNDVAIYDGHAAFIYTNSTDHRPSQPEQLKQIAGHGQSPLIRYDGTGAYFIDQWEKGVWRLEIMPDVLLVSNPFGRNSLDKKVAEIQWNERSMSLDIPDLGSNFSFYGLNAGNDRSGVAEDKALSVTPGVYLLKRKGTTFTLSDNALWGEYTPGHFVAPQTSLEQLFLVNHSPTQRFAGDSIKLSIQLASPTAIQSVKALLRQGRSFREVELERESGFNYMAVVNTDESQEGFLEYYLIVETLEGVFTYPSGKAGKPFDWDFHSRDTYVVRVLPTDTQVTLFDADTDAERLRFSRWPRGLKKMPAGDRHGACLEIKIDSLYSKDAENPNGPRLYDFTVRHFPAEKIPLWHSKSMEADSLVIVAGIPGPEPLVIELALVDRHGKAFGKQIELQGGIKEYCISLQTLEDVPTVLMPRPYPGFLPYFFSHQMDHKLDIHEVESVQLRVGPGWARAEQNDGFTLRLSGIYLR